MKNSKKKTQSDGTTVLSELYSIPRTMTVGEIKYERLWVRYRTWSKKRPGSKL